MSDTNTLIIPIVAGVLFLIFAIALIIGCYYLRKRQRNKASMYFRNTGPTSSTHLLTEQRPHSEDRSTLLSCQSFIKENPMYTFHSELPRLGSNQDKSWFLLTAISKTGTTSNMPTHILTLQTKSDQVTQFNDQRSGGAYMKTLNSLFNRLYHPYVEPINKVDFMYVKNLIVTIRPFQHAGSLKDLIQNTTPTFPYENKYANRSAGLSLDRVRIFTRQLLDALLFLQSKYMPPMVDFHSGNIVVAGAALQLGGYEYKFLEQHSRIYPHIQRAVASITLADGMTQDQLAEIICFGGVVFEMLTGYELGKNLKGLTPKNWQDCGRDPDARDMLNRIFDKTQSAVTLSQIRELPYFLKNTTPLKELQNFKPIPGDYSSDVKNLLERSGKKVPTYDKRRPAETTTTTTKPSATEVIDIKTTLTLPPPSTPSSKRSTQTNVPPATLTSPPPTRPVTTSTPVVSQTPAPPPPPPPAAPAPPPPPAPSTSAPPPSGGDGDRNALLGQIHQGIKLKKTVTNDRSTPKFK